MTHPQRARRRIRLIRSLDLLLLSLAVCVSNSAGGRTFEFEYAVQVRPIAEGEIEGYHCWVELHLDETGWLPIDAAEASKHPEKRELFYGTHPADRIHFTTGRDLKLGPDHHGPPLNFFIYPHVEVDGEPHEGPIETRFHYRERPHLLGEPPLD